MARGTFAVKIDQDVINRIRAAAGALQDRDRSVTLAGLVEEALDAGVSDLEARYNGGQPFPPLTTPLRPGRRLAVDSGTETSADDADTQI